MDSEKSNSKDSEINDTISLLNPNDDTLNKVNVEDYKNLTFKSFEEFSGFLLSTFEKKNIEVFRETDVFEVGEELGKGAFGVVNKAIRKGETYAIKFLDKIDHTLPPDKTIFTILNELKNITKVKHERIPHFYGVYQKDEKLGLVFSFITGSTLNIYFKKNKISNLEKCNLLIQLVEILVNLHSKRVIHRDIKPKNTMITPEGKLILIDFGISRINEHTVAKTMGVNGSPAYSPPEAFIDINKDSEDRTFEITTKFDVWSVGCVMLEMYSGEKPWQKKFKDSNKIMFALSKGTTFKGSYVPIPEILEKEYPKVLEVISKCLIKDVMSRYTSKELLSKLLELKEFYSK